MTRALLLVLAACGGSLPAPRYVAPSDAPPGWCRVGPGAYAFQTTPSTHPALVKTCPLPSTYADTSTLTEYVVEPGTAIELDIVLPAALADAGCIVDSLVLAHAEHAGDLAIAFRSGTTPAAVGDERDTTRVSRAHEGDDPARGVRESARDDRDTTRVPRAHDGDDPARDVRDTALPIVGYERVPAVMRTPLADRPPPHERPGHYQTLGAELARIGDHLRGPVVIGASQDPTRPAPRTLRMTAVRHAIAQPASPRFTFVLRARERAFSIAVRTTDESHDPPLRARARADAPAVPTTFVPLAAVVLRHCRVPARAAFASIQTR